MSVVQYIVRTIVNNDLWIVFTKYRPGKCSYGKESHGITIVEGTTIMCIPRSERLYVVGLGSGNIVISTIRHGMINTLPIYNG